MCALRPRLVSRKTSEDGVKNLLCLSDKGASLEDFRQRTPVFRVKQDKYSFLLIPLLWERVSEGRVRSLDFFVSFCVKAKSIRFPKFSSNLRKKSY
jgi:hypothetical protein